MIKNFREVILKGANEARENSTIVTLEIKPDKPEPGYGYIEVNNTESLLLDEIYKVRRFRKNQIKK